MNISNTQFIAIAATLCFSLSASADSQFDQWQHWHNQGGVQKNRVEEVEIKDFAIRHEDSIIFDFDRLCDPLGQFSCIGQRSLVMGMDPSEGAHSINLRRQEYRTPEDRLSSKDASRDKNGSTVEVSMEDLPAHNFDEEELEASYSPLIEILLYGHPVNNQDGDDGLSDL